MNIAIIDADLITRKKHRFPNLASMKISGYYKELGNNVQLVTEYNEEKLRQYDKVFLSKVFTDTDVPEWVLKLSNIEYGGTGFFYDKAPKLPKDIEHHMPDYHLYDEWVKKQIENGGKKIDFKYYTDYSIGFTTRGCFRKCQFCVNKNYARVSMHSQLDEFVDPQRNKICLLDDNILGCSHWKEIFKAIQSTGKPFQFKQGLDERILTEEKCKVLFNSKYDGDYIFAFDNVNDYPVIENKLQLIRQYTNITPKFYCFCGFDRNDIWDIEFWKQDIDDLFKRIELLMKYKCLPYIMRFNRYEESPYRGMYIIITMWCNQPSIFKKKSLREFVNMRKELRKKSCAYYDYLQKFEKDCPEIAARYLDIKWLDTTKQLKVTMMRFK